MVNADVYERYMLDLINDERTSRGLDPLQLERSLNQSAEDHSLWMLETNTFSHTGVNGTSATDRMDAAGFVRSGSWRTAENIAVQSERGPDGIMDDVAQLHQSLMDSPGHRANILNPDLDYIGIGIELGEFDFNTNTFTSVIVTQNFGATQGPVDLDTGDTPAPQPTPVAVVETPPKIQGDDSANVLEGTDAGEVIRGEGGDDTLNGEAGADMLRGGQGDDTIYGGADNDTAYGGGGHDYIRGEDGNDRIFGGSGNDIIRGGRNDDTLLGAAGDDQLFGGSGDDRINGQAGDDRLTGSSGEDRFIFREGYDTDRILDFEDNVDTIDLSSFGFATVDEALDNARQSGSVVVFDFDSGDVLRVRDATLIELENDLLI